MCTPAAVSVVLGGLGLYQGYQQGKAQKEQVRAANEQAARDTAEANRQREYTNKVEQEKVDAANAEIDRQNLINRMVIDRENEQIRLDNRLAQARDALKRRQIDEYNARGTAASALEQESIQESLAGEYAAIDLRAGQEALQTAHQNIQRMRQGLRERSTLVARSADSGVIGNSSSRDAIASAIWEAEDMGIIDENYGNTIAQLRMSKKGAQAQAQSELNRSVFYSEGYEMATPLTPERPYEPMRAHMPAFTPLEPIGAPVKAKGPSDFDVVTRTLSAGAQGYATGVGYTQQYGGSSNRPTTPTETGVSGNAR